MVHNVLVTKLPLLVAQQQVSYSDSVDKVLLYDITRNCCRALAPLPFPVSCTWQLLRGEIMLL